MAADAAKEASEPTIGSRRLVINTRVPSKIPSRIAAKIPSRVHDRSHYELPDRYEGGMRRHTPPPKNETINKLLKTARDGYGTLYGHKEYCSSTSRKLGLLNWLRIYIFRITGCRIGEAVMLQVSDFDLENRIVYIQRAYREKEKTEGPPKRGSKRTLPLSERACGDLKTAFRYLRLKPDDYCMSGRRKRALDPSTGRSIMVPVFCKPCAIRRTLKEIAKAAGLDGKKIFPHLFRVLMGTRLEARSVKLASQALGHSEKDGGQTLETSYTRHWSDESSQIIRDTMDDEDLIGPD